MRFSVEAWAPEYGTPTELGDLDSDEVQVDVHVEVPARNWEPRTPTNTVPPDSILFVDGIRRIDGRVWILDENGEGARPGICASFAAGVVRCEGTAQVVATDVARGLFTGASGAEAIETVHARYPVAAVAGDSPESLQQGLQQRMVELEVSVAEQAGGMDLVVIDGPLRGRQHIPEAVGYIKTHHVNYLPDAMTPIIGRLEPGQRTPLVLMSTSWSRFSWYSRLPGEGGHPWAGIVRCEITADTEATNAATTADVITSLLPRFASSPHKDPRAPQNLYPVAGLERELRRRLGDTQLLYRSLKRAAGA